MRNNVYALKSEFIFSIANKTIRNYESLFKVKFPFTKLDYVMCPEFKYGGMENVGCITYAENYMCRKQQMSFAEELYLNIII